MIVVIDCGHDSIVDNKNIGYSGKYKEHLGNWEYGLKLKKYLEQDGFRVYLTRDTNTPLSLSKRAEVAIEKKANIFVSIHSDAFDVTSSGSTCFYSINRPNDKIIAERIVKCVAQSYGINNRGAKTKASTSRQGFDYYTVIDVAANYRKLTKGSFEVPHVFLIERAFHSNPKEEKLLLDENVSDKSAKALALELSNIFLGRKDDKTMSKTWQQDLGEKALDSLGEKKLVNNVEDWKKKDLTNEPTPLWLFFEMLNRITK